MNKIAVTGGAGFLGSHIVDLLIKKGYEVIVIDDLSNGKKDYINSAAHFYEVNICDPFLREVLGKEGPDAIIHAAAHTSVKESFIDPRFDAHTNIIGSIGLLSACKDLCIDKVVYASSTEIFGEPEYLPIDEKHPIRPTSPYAASNNSVENYLYYYKKIHGIDYDSLRISNIYGPRQNPQTKYGIVGGLIKDILSNTPPTIKGNGTQTKDFVYVTDVAEAFILALEKSTPQDAFNIGTGIKTSINSVHTQISEILGIQINPEYSNEENTRAPNLAVNASLAKEKLSWEPKTALEDGLKKTVKWFKDNYSFTR